MKKIEIKNTNLFQLFKKSPKHIRKGISIDIIFYLFITLGFFAISYISNYFHIEPFVASVIWTACFIPILLLKLKKDISLK